LQAEDGIRDSHVTGVQTCAHSDLGAGPGESYQVLGADVRGEERAADDEPARVATGKEVVGGVARPFAPFAQCRPDRDTEHEHEVQCDDDPVGCGELIHVPSPVSATSVGSRTAYVPGMPSTEYDAPRPAMAWPA